MADIFKDTVDKEQILEVLIRKILTLPGAMVDRERFLREEFGAEPVALLNKILEEGPVEAGIPQLILLKKANALTTEESLKAGAITFMTGLPLPVIAGIAVPADIIKFYGTTIRLAQEIAYLYGQKDLRNLDNDDVVNQMIIYLGAMLGATGAAEGVRMMASKLAVKFPEFAITKRMYQMINTFITRWFAANLTKKAFVDGVGNVVFLLGGIISGTFTLVIMKSMGKKLIDTLDCACFGYNEEMLEADFEVVSNIDEDDVEEEKETFFDKIKLPRIEFDFEDTSEKLADIKDSIKDKIKIPEIRLPKKTEEKEVPTITDEIIKAKELLKDRIITEEEFKEIKRRLIEKI